MQATLKAEECLRRLMEIIVRLRSPSGCLWDRQQNDRDIARYLLEEAYEAVEAVEKGSAEDVREELGDLLFQIIFLAHLAEEKGEFDLAGVMTGVEEKMIRRHPHVFGNISVECINDIKDNWEVIKKTEGKTVSEYGRRFAGITKALPALLRAQKITKEAARVGFDWEKTDDVLYKVEEELSELKDAIKTNHRDRIAEEMGDLLFSLVNLCRFLNLDAETTLRGTITKFSDRFSHIEEELLKAGKTPAEASLAEMDRLWEEAKLKRNNSK
jgi:tetrapyrrole methylase family protein / MazG family protein